MIKLTFYIIRFVWEVPQNILGIIIYFLNKKKINSVQKLDGRFYFQNNNFGISLGSFIFWMPNLQDKYSEIPVVLKHEFGHSIQSLYFGPLYLIVIGIPSIARVIYAKIFYRIKKSNWRNYYEGFPEKWADVLGEKHFKKLPYKNT